MISDTSASDELFAACVRACRVVVVAAMACSMISVVSSSSSSSLTTVLTAGPLAITSRCAFSIAAIAVSTTEAVLAAGARLLLFGTGVSDAVDLSEPVDSALTLRRPRPPLK